MLSLATAYPGMTFDRRVGHRDDGHLQVGRLEICRSLIELCRRQAIDDAGELRHRIVGDLRIGRMSLLAVDDEFDIERAAPADPDFVAEGLRVRRLADEAGIDHLVARLQPVEHLHRAVDRRPFFIARDQERQRAAWQAAIVMNVFERRGDERRDAYPSCRRRRGHRADRRGFRRANGGTVQAASSPAGTTSVCPANERCGRPEPRRA